MASRFTDWMGKARRSAPPQALSAIQPARWLQQHVDPPKLEREGAHTQKNVNDLRPWNGNVSKEHHPTVFVSGSLYLQLRNSLDDGDCLKGQGSTRWSFGVQAPPGRRWSRRAPQQIDLDRELSSIGQWTSFPGT